MYFHWLNQALGVDFASKSARVAEMSDEEYTLRENMVLILNDYVDEDHATLIFIAEELIKRAVMPEIERLNNQWATLNYAVGPH